MQFIEGNLLEAQAEALVNTVNTVGVMGKGIALQFREAFPQNYNAYLKACKSGELQIGNLLIFKEKTLQGEKWIINFPTKKDWKHKSKYEYIEAGLKELVQVIQENDIKSIALPPLGCGNGGLEWARVKTMIIQYLSNLPNVEIFIYEPNESIKAALQKKSIDKNTHLTPARAILLYALFYYETLGEDVSLFVANKLAYFMQRLGENLKLSFVKSHYGPYSVQVEHVLYAMNGSYIKGLEQRKTSAFEHLELNYLKLEELKSYINQELSDTQRYRLQSLTRLIDGFQSALPLEVLATIDFLLQENKNMSEQALIQEIHSWSDRKAKLFKEEYIKIALQHLKDNQNRLSFH